MDKSVGESTKRCDICGIGNIPDEELLLGPWMEKREITVHYYCLLLSTNLPQRGEDCSGIQGFLLRDIRVEIAAAAKRRCVFCDKVGASIGCDRCKDYFDIECGIRNQCLFQFAGEFKSFCADCIKLDDFQKETRKRWKNSECYICKEFFGSKYTCTEQLYAPCCRNGFVHRKCMQKYAVESGYYLRCIWCRSDSLRETIRWQGIFVPDREANWEKKLNYQDLHKGHRRCDAENCLCNKGRYYSSKNWTLINCFLCGSFGIHYPRCITKTENDKFPSIEEFKCDTCEATERTAFENGALQDLAPSTSTSNLQMHEAEESRASFKDTSKEAVAALTTAEYAFCNGNESESSCDKACQTEMMLTETLPAPYPTKYASAVTIIDLTETDENCDLQECAQMSDQVIDLTESDDYLD